MVLKQHQQLLWIEHLLQQKVTSSSADSGIACSWGQSCDGVQPSQCTKRRAHLLCCQPAMLQHVIQHLCRSILLGFELLFLSDRNVCQSHTGSNSCRRSTRCAYSSMHASPFLQLLPSPSPARHSAHSPQLSVCQSYPSPWQPPTNTIPLSFF